MVGRGTPTEQIFSIVSIVLIGLCIMFGVYILFAPEFSSAKTLAMGTILGALISLATAILGVNAASTAARKQNSGSGGDE